MSGNQYPEHLNPFSDTKGKLTLSSSFRELKRTLRHSFRIKKKHKEPAVEIRKKEDTLRPPALSYNPVTPVLLPRSRFRERLSLSPTTSTPPGNPFEEGEVERNTVKKKRKKRAPLPPKSHSSQNVNDDDDNQNSSRWSLTSADTDYTYSTNNASSRDGLDIDRLSLTDDFASFTERMERLNQTTEEKQSNNNIPDLVITCAENKEESKSNASDISDNIIVRDVTDNMLNGNKVKEVIPVQDESAVREEVEDELKEENGVFMYHEKKSLYIAGSRDELNDNTTYTGRVSIYIAGSKDNLDAANNNEEIDKVPKTSDIEETGPVPKLRKNKLTKQWLLGTS